jgi:hypothetical protein
MPQRVIDLADLIAACDDVTAARSVLREVIEPEAIDNATARVMRAERRLCRLCRVTQTVAA